MDIRKDDGYTPLHLAALNDHLDVVTSFAEHVRKLHIFPFNKQVANRYTHYLYAYCNVEKTPPNRVTDLKSREIT